MNNMYSLKQIMFALRQEYIELQKLLKDLEKYVDITGKIDEIEFCVHDFNHYKNVNIYLRKEQTLLDKIREKTGFIGIYTRGVAFWKVPEEIEVARYWKRKKVCSFNDIEGLTTDINHILESDLVKNSIISVMCEKDNFTLNSNARGVRAASYKNDVSVIGYNSKLDTIGVTRKQEIITPDYIHDLLNIEFGCERFNDYHKGIIDNYEEKEIDIVDTFDSNHTKLEIIEEPKKLILKPKKNI